MNKIIESAKTLLTEIFGFDKSFEEDEKIESFCCEYITGKFKIIFRFNGKIIESYIQEKNNDFFLVIDEKITHEREIDSSNYNAALNEVLSVLEDNYKINFTPLDPEEKDKNIKEINEGVNNFFAKFVKEEFNSSFEVNFFLLENKYLLKIIERRKHIILLEVKE